MDVGSTKRDVIDAARRVLRDHVGSFVPCHPDRRQGSVRRRTRRRRPVRAASRSSSRRSSGPRSFTSSWPSNCGRRWAASVQQMAPDAHDAAFAAVSHLPHLIAFALIMASRARSMGSDFLSLAGPGFRDFTRIAASDPKIWRDILMANSDELLAQAQDLPRSLPAMRCRPIESGDAEALEAHDRAGQPFARQLAHGPEEVARAARRPACSPPIPGHPAAGECRRRPWRCRAPRASPTASCCWRRWRRHDHRARPARFRRHARHAGRLAGAWVRRGQAGRGRGGVDGPGRPARRRRSRACSWAMPAPPCGRSRRPWPSSGGDFELSRRRAHARTADRRPGRCAAAARLPHRLPGRRGLSRRWRSGRRGLRWTQPIQVRGDVSSQFLTALLLALPLVATRRTS